MSEPVSRTFTLQELQDYARAYMHATFGTPKSLADEEAKAVWYTRYGVLLEFNQQMFDGEIQPFKPSEKP